MSDTYAGDATNYPTSITLPEDGDAPIQVSDVRPGFEGLKDGLANVVAYRLPLPIQEDHSSPGDALITVATGATSKVLTATAALGKTYAAANLSVLVMATMEIYHTDSADLPIDVTLGTTLNGVDLDAITQRANTPGDSVTISFAITRSCLFATGQSGSSASVYLKVNNSLSYNDLKIRNISIAGHILRNGG